MIIPVTYISLIKISKSDEFQRTIFISFSFFLVFSCIDLWEGILNLKVNIMQSMWMLVNASCQVVTAHTRGISPVNSLDGTASIQHGISDQGNG